MCVSSNIKRNIKDSGSPQDATRKQSQMFNIPNPKATERADVVWAQNEANTWEQSDWQSGVYLFRAQTKWNSEKSNKLRGDVAVRMLTHIRWTANPKSPSGFIVKNVSEASFNLLSATKEYCFNKSGDAHEVDNAKMEFNDHHKLTMRCQSWQFCKAEPSDSRLANEDYTYNDILYFRCRGKTNRRHWGRMKYLSVQGHMLSTKWG